MKKTTPSKAFARATAGYELFGKKLFPFSSMRQGAVASMGLRFGLVDQQDIFSVTVEELKGKKKQSHELQFYNQLFSDVIKVMWACSVPDSRVLRAERKVDEAKAEAFAWADQNEIGLSSPNYYAAAAVFFQMMQDISVSTGKPVIDNQGEEDDDNPNE